MYYGFPEADAKGAVPESECFKAFRAAQLVAYRQTLAATLMAEPAGLSRGSLRLLDELRERFNISEARHASEMTIAAADPVVVAVQRSGVTRDTARFEDPMGDVPVPAGVSADAADDGGRIIAPTAKPGKSNRPAASPLPNQTARPQPPAEPDASAAQRAALDALTKQIEATSKQLLRTRDSGERVTLRMRMKDYDRKLDEMLKG